MKFNVLICSVVGVMLFAAVPTALASTTWYVNGVIGSDSNKCLSPSTACKTIGHAISLASSGDSLMVAAATYTEHLSISFSLKIIGSGSTTTIIDGGGVGRVVTISNANAHVTLSKLFIRHGFTYGFGGGIANAGANAGTLTINNSIISGNIARGTSSAGVGAGIANSGTVTIINSTFSGNTVSGPFGAGFGGGIYNIGTATIKNSTFRLNTASGSGGGIHNRGGNLTINNSTLSGNSASLVGATGGGIYNNQGKMAINNSTISGNKATSRGGGIYNQGEMAINSSTISGNQATSGGGIFTAITVTLQNSIIASSPSGGNCSGTIASKGYDLSSDGTCNFSGAGDLNNTDPMLGLLQNNGGPTQTMALPSGSPAVDAGNPSGCTDSNGFLLKTDQRGKPRPDPEDTGGCDIGAYERQSD